MDLTGKTIDFLGDSLTEGVGVVDRERNRFDNIIRRECGLKKTNNYGIGGTRIAHQFYPSAKARWDLDFCGRLFDMDPSADVVVVFGGGNDYYHGDAQFGEIGDTDRTTFCGSVYYLVSMIKELYPSAVHVFITPMRLRYCTLPSQSKHKRPGTEMRPLKDYVDAIANIASAQGFRVFNAYECLGIDPDKPEDRAKYIASDDVHMVDAGHQVLAAKLIGFLKSI